MTNFLNKIEVRLIQQISTSNVRDDLLVVYRATMAGLYSDPLTAKKFISIIDTFWIRKATQYSEEVKRTNLFEENTVELIKNIKKFNFFDHIYSLFQGFLAIGLIISFLITGFFYQSNLILTIILTLITSLIFIINLITLILFNINKINFRILQNISRHFVIPPSEYTYSPKRSEDLASICIWNQSLCNINMIKSLIVLAFIKKYSRRIYQTVFQLMVDGFPLYMPSHLYGSNNEGIRTFMVRHYLENWKKYRAIKIYS